MWRALIKGWLKNTFSDGELQLQDDLKTHLLFQSNGRLTCRVTQQWFLKKTLIRLYCLNFFADIYNLNVLTIFILFLSGPKRHLLDTNRGYLLTGTFFQTAINIWKLVNLKFVFYWDLCKKLFHEYCLGIQSQFFCTSSDICIKIRFTVTCCCKLSLFETIVTGSICRWILISNTCTVAAIYIYMYIHILFFLKFLDIVVKLFCLYSLIC